MQEQNVIIPGGVDRRSHIDNSALMYKLGAVETKLDGVLKLSDDVDSLKTSRTYGRGALAILAAWVGFAK